ncbi:MAG: J domain-containing protein [Treponema sp.]|nr:J domain-containing protein [Treponema sp.]
METMYDRLGELLNETLKDGYVKSSEPQKETERFTETETQASSLKNKNGFTWPKGKKKKTTSFEKNSSEKNSSEKKSVESKKKVEKIFSPEAERALRLFSLDENYTEEELKKAYKEKLNVFHPDKNKKLPIVQKVAAEKTRQVVEAFRLLSDLLNGSSLK